MFLILTHCNTFCDNIRIRDDIRPSGKVLAWSFWQLVEMRLESIGDWANPDNKPSKPFVHNKIRQYPSKGTMLIMLCDLVGTGYQFVHNPEDVDAQ